MHCHQPTKDYLARRTAEGKSKKEILRCLKRYIVREVYPRLLATAPARAMAHLEPGQRKTRWR
jgi:transposase